MLEKASRSAADPQHTAAEPLTESVHRHGAGLDQRTDTNCPRADHLPADQPKHEQPESGHTDPGDRAIDRASTPTTEHSTPHLVAGSRAESSANGQATGTAAGTDDALHLDATTSAPTTIADDAADERDAATPADRPGTDGVADASIGESPRLDAGTPTSALARAGRAGGLIIAPGWREREAQRNTAADARVALLTGAAALRTVVRNRPTVHDLRAVLHRRPSAEELGALLRRHRLLIGGLAVTLLLSAADTQFGSLITERPPWPGEQQRVAAAYPLQLQTPTPSVRRYLDAVENGERLREQAVVAAAARATLQRAKAEAAAVVAGERLPWIGSMPAPVPVPPGSITPHISGYVLPALGVFTSGFGQRWGTFHNGIDIAGPIGSPIYAVADGTVIDAGPASGFGLWVRIRHDDGTVSVYGHMYDFVVSRGERIRAGMQIARMGNRGDSTGPHLHFEIIVGGRHIDPQRWLALRGLTFEN